MPLPPRCGDGVWQRDKTCGCGIAPKDLSDYIRLRASLWGPVVQLVRTHGS